MPLATFRCMYFNTYRSISNKNRRSYNYAVYIYPSNIFFWRKLNPHNKWKCVRCWKWKKSCAIGPYENIHKVYYICYSAVYFLPILLFDVTVLFKAYRKNLQQHKQAEPLFHMKKKYDLKTFFSVIWLY